MILIPSYIFMISCLRWVIFCFLSLFSHHLNTPFKISSFLVSFLKEFYLPHLISWKKKVVFTTAISAATTFNFVSIATKKLKPFCVPSNQIKTSSTSCNVVRLNCYLFEKKSLSTFSCSEYSYDELQVFPLPQM